MARAQAGDRLAYGHLLAEIVPYLRSIASRYLGSSPDLEDAVQEILLSVHAIRHTYEPSRPFRPWLVTIASRRLIDALRRRSRNLLHEVETTDTMPELASDDPDPSAIADRIVEIREVRRAIAGLPPRQREAVQLLRLQELSLDEAATASGQSQGSLKVACHRALKGLARILQGGTGGGGAHD
jgi:RNA polymerase sigma-70 factor (ECF subfamily)